MRKATIFALAGGVLAMGAPAGLVILRSAIAGDPSLHFVRNDVASEPALYGYVALSTLLAFACFGAFTGSRADALDRLSRVDHLTGLFNRRAMDEAIQHEHARARRHGSTLAFLLIDVDGLKAINDSSGHRVGDAAIRAVAESIRVTSRQTDLCARWGGDEFAVLASASDEAQARLLAERIRGDVIVRSGGVTVSVGVATLNPHRETGAIESLIGDADAALYKAKVEGRNRVRGAGPEI